MHLFASELESHKGTNYPWPSSTVYRNSCYFNVCTIGTSTIVCFDSFNEKIEQYRIHFKGNTYTIDDEDTFVDLSELVEHYQQDADGLVTRLITPVEKEEKSKSVITVMEVDDLMKCKQT